MLVVTAICTYTCLCITFHVEHFFLASGPFQLPYKRNLFWGGANVTILEGLGSPVNLRPPPAHADEQETPVVEEFRRLAFEGMADELKDPPDHKQCQRDPPEAVEEEPGDEYSYRKQNRRDAEGVAEAVDRMLVAGRVLGDPLLAGASA